MNSRKEELQIAFLNVVNASLKLKALDKAEKESIEVAGRGVEDFERTSYNKAVEELNYLHDIFDQLWEDAKHNLTSGLDQKIISFFDKIERADADVLQAYYMNEMHSNLTYIVNRSLQITPLFVIHNTLLSIEHKYREAVLCYIYGRFDACCVMCRSILEMMLRELCKDKFKQSQFEDDTFIGYIETCRNFNILDAQSLAKVDRIRKNGNSSIHTEDLAGEEDALQSINDTQDLLKVILRDKKYFNRK